MTDSGPSRKVRKIVRARSHGRCEFAGCGLLATEIHHRYERGMGGFGPKSPAAAWINEPANLLDSCAHHNQWASNHEPLEAHRIGWIIKEVDGEPELPWTVSVVTAHHPLPIYLSNVDAQWACFQENLPENDLMSADQPAAPEPASPTSGSDHPAPAVPPATPEDVSPGLGGSYENEGAAA